MAVLPTATRPALIPFAIPLPNARPLLDAVLATTQQLSLMLSPHGMQHGARRNAYRAVIADDAAALHRKSIRADVEAAIAASIPTQPRLVSLPREYQAPTG